MTEASSLDGIRVLDLTRLLPGPFASMVLSDLGAQVDKVEDPRGGDYLRVTPPLAGDGMSHLHHWLNRGKRSVELDLKTPAGVETLKRMVPHYDVLLEGNRPGVMDRLGLGYETLRALHPGLIYCALTGYGQDGPLANRAGHDLNYLARCGALGLFGPEDQAPALPGVQIADVGGGLYAVIGVLAALAARARSGEGRLVDVSLSESALTFGTFGFASRIGGFSPPRGADMLMGGIAPYGTYLTSDGGAVSLGSLEPKFWKAFCEGVGIEPDNLALFPGKHQSEWKERLRGIFASRTRAEWAELAERLDCCLEVVVEPADALEDPHLRARGVWSTVQTDDGGTVTMGKTPVAPAATGRAPRQGEHTSDILREAGLSDDEITALRGR
ncbi:MAG: CoA transferase [Myxococcales bacterium]|nr:CoA transferase [Myxococcales bacterium]